MRSSFSAPPVHIRQALSPRAKDTLRTMCLCCRVGGQGSGQQAAMAVSRQLLGEGRAGRQGHKQRSLQQPVAAAFGREAFWHSGIASSIGLMTKRLNQWDDRQEWTEDSSSVTDRLARAGGIAGEPGTRR